MQVSQFNAKVAGACGKKAALMDKSPARYMVRSAFAGGFLTLTSLAGFAMGDVFNTLHPTLGRFIFPFVFCWGLIYILFLNGELITSNMRYLTAGLYRQWIAPRKALKMVVLCTVGNIVGAYFVAWLASYTSALQVYDATGMAATMVGGKLAKSGMEIIFAGTMANLLVNIAILSWLLIENQAARMATVMSAIIMFVYLGFEHVVANFGSFALLYFSPATTAGFTFGNILRQWGLAYLGNYIGGGLLIGLVYAWLNRGADEYVD